MNTSSCHGWSVHTTILPVMAGVTYILRESVTVPYWRVINMQVGLALVVFFGLLFSVRLWALYTKHFILLRAIPRVIMCNVRVDLICLTIGSVMLYYAAMNGTNVHPMHLAIWYAAIFTCLYVLIFARQISLWVLLLERFDAPLQ